MQNPLLKNAQLPKFSAIKVEHIETALDHHLQTARKQIATILAATDRYTWENLCAPLEAIHDKISSFWSPISHLNSVMSSDVLRKVHDNCLTQLSDYYTELGQNEQLYQATRSLVASPLFAELDTAQQKALNNELRDFRLSGIELAADDKQQYKQLQRCLTKLSSQFSNNVLDATHAWCKHIRNENLLTGLPEHSIQTAKLAADKQGLDGWVFSLDFPVYHAVMCYADDREFRREMYTAFVTRASDQGLNAKQWDNASIMAEILQCRHDLANLLGFDNYAEYSLATKMAETPTQVVEFLYDLVAKSKAVAEQEFNQLKEYAQELGCDDISAWDVAYFSEKLRQERFAISQEDLRPYFLEARVFQGMFALVQKLYGIELRQVTDVDVWHDDVKFYEVYDAEGELQGQLYVDLFARTGKRAGAWMDECRVRRRLSVDSVQLPAAYLTCNFTMPSGDKPSLLTHDEVITLFHEFGHCLHHLLTKIDYASVSGINGVPWDAVELPSQFMENWCWQYEVLADMTQHYQTGEPLPKAMFDRLYATKNFHSALGILRQMELALFDFEMHKDYQYNQTMTIHEKLNNVRQQVAVIKPPEFNRFENSFSHIFAGGYAAGYYSYVWAEVLSADAYAKFEEDGILNAETGRQFLQCILERGGSAEPAELFRLFRGRDPSIEALLRHSGIAMTS